MPSGFGTKARVGARTNSAWAPHTEGIRQHAEDFVAGPEQGDSDAHGLDDTGDVPAEDERRRWEEGTVASVLPVRGVHTSGVDADEDLGWARLRNGQLDLMEDFGASELVLADGPHRGPVRDD